MTDPGAAGSSSALTLAVGAAPLVAAVDPAEGPLDLYEGIRTRRFADPRTGGCARWPEGQHLVNLGTGELVPGRCKATNLCRYCQALYVLETLEMLSLDAAENAPTLWMVLTAREHLTRADATSHLRDLRRYLRRTWPDVEWFVQVEFQRRGALHLNLLIKGVPAEEAIALHTLATQRWCSRVDAQAVGQWIGAVNEAGGLVRYLQKTLSHGLKQEQAPPIGWRGHRTSQTRGYLVRPAAVMREEAREAIKLRRALWHARKAGHEGEAAEAVAQAELLARRAQTWRLYHQAQRKSVPVQGPAPVPERVLLAAWVEQFDADVERCS